MAKREFEVKREEFDRRGRSMIQHKLRVLLKSYTVYDFSMNEEDQTYSFKRTIRKRGVIIKIDKQLSGRYEYEIIDEEKATLTLWIE